VQAAIDNALAGQAAANLQKEREFRQVIDALTSQVAELRAAPTTSRSSAPTPEIKVYAAIEIRDTVQCSEPLDAVKCLPEFAGPQESYVS